MKLKWNVSSLPKYLSGMTLFDGPGWVCSLSHLSDKNKSHLLWMNKGSGGILLEVDATSHPYNIPLIVDQDLYYYEEKYLNDSEKAKWPGIFHHVIAQSLRKVRLNPYDFSERIVIDFSEDSSKHRAPIFKRINDSRYICREGDRFEQGKETCVVCNYDGSEVRRFPYFARGLLEDHVQHDEFIGHFYDTAMVRVRKIEISTGNVLAEFVDEENVGGFFHVAVVGDSIYIFGKKVHKIDYETFEPIWEFSAADMHVTSVPCFTDDTVYFGMKNRDLRGDNLMLGIAQDDGQVSLRIEIPCLPGRLNRLEAKPVCDDGQLIFTNLDGRLSVYDVAQSSLIDSYCFDKGHIKQSAICDQDYIYCCAGEGPIICLERAR